MLAVYLLVRGFDTWMLLLALANLGVLVLKIGAHWSSKPITGEKPERLSNPQLTTADNG